MLLGLLKNIHRLAFLIAVILLIIAVVLLLNITAPNPTHRRYSSQIPLTTGQSTANALGLDGERILAADLGLPRNDEPDQLQCVCRDPGFSDKRNCRVCLAYSPISSTYRRPDFVGSDFIAESKNARNLYYESRDLDQITDFAIAARELKKPLWVYTRVNTIIDPQFESVVNATGGGVVRYFGVPGYVDSVDMTAQSLLLPSVTALLLSALFEVVVRRRNVVMPLRVRSSANPPTPSDPTARAKKAVDAADQFLKDNKEKSRKRLD
jgi:hypothetical protein